VREIKGERRRKRKGKREREIKGERRRNRKGKRERERDVQQTHLLAKKVQNCHF
jgi:hypothetical protein